MFDAVLVGKSRQGDVLLQSSDRSFSRVCGGLDEQLVGDRVDGDLERRRRRREQARVDRRAKFRQHLVLGNQNLTNDQPHRITGSRCYQQAQSRR